MSLDNNSGMEEIRSSAGFDGRAGREPAASCCFIAALIYPRTGTSGGGTHVLWTGQRASVSPDGGARSIFDCLAAKAHLSRAADGNPQLQG
jgi:hypothetical protein